LNSQFLVVERETETTTALLMAVVKEMLKREGKKNKGRSGSQTTDNGYRARRPTTAYYKPNTTQQSRQLDPTPRQLIISIWSAAAYPVVAAT